MLKSMGRCDRLLIKCLQDVLLRVHTLHVVVPENTLDHNTGNIVNEWSYLLKQILNYTVFILNVIKFQSWSIKINVQSTAHQICDVNLTIPVCFCCKDKFMVVFLVVYFGDCVQYVRKWLASPQTMDLRRTHCRAHKVSFLSYSRWQNCSSNLTSFSLWESR